MDGQGKVLKIKIFGNNQRGGKLRGVGKHVCVQCAIVHVLLNLRFDDTTYLLSSDN